MPRKRIRKFPVKEQQIKSEYIINPLTGRLIKVGSKKYLQLLKDQILDLNHKDRENFMMYEGDDAPSVKEKLQVGDNYNLSLKNNKIVRTVKKIPIIDYIDHTITTAINLIKNDLDDLNIHKMSDDEVDDVIRGLLNQKLIDPVS
jgi:hypothetical protein